MAKKRARVHGTVYPVAGRKLYRAQVRTEDGGRVGVYRKTKDEAERWLTNALHEAEQGLLVAIDRKTTLAAYLTQWLSDEQMQWEPKTYESYEGAVRLHLIPALGHLKLAELRPDVIQRGYNRLLTCECPKDAHDKKTCTRRGTRTIQNAHNVLHIALERAASGTDGLRILAKNPAKGAHPPKHVPKESTIWTMEQARSFVAAIEGTRWYALYLLAIFCGLRRGELVGLRWANVINLDGPGSSGAEPHVLIRRKVVRVAGRGKVEGGPKNDKPRPVPIPPLVAAALMAHRPILAATREGAGDRWQENDLIFPTTSTRPGYTPGRLMPPEMVNKHFAGLTAELGLPPARLHDLRHTFDTLMAAEGVAPKVRMRLMGHSNLSQTIGVYEGLLDGADRDAVNRLEKRWHHSGTTNPVPPSGQPN